VYPRRPGQHQFPTATCLRAREELDRLNGGGESVAIAYLTLAEAYSLVLRRMGAAYAQRWLKQVIDGSMLINPEPRDFLRAVDAILSLKGQSITIFDAVAAAVSHRLNLAVWTYDRHFDVLGSKRWT